MFKDSFLKGHICPSECAPFEIVFPHSYYIPCVIECWADRARLVSTYGVGKRATQLRIESECVFGYEVRSRLRNRDIHVIYSLFFERIQSSF